jgi:PAS domain S-box-containing protein
MEEAADSGELWRLTWEHSPIGMALVGLDGRLLVVNRAFSDMLGYDSEHLSRSRFQELTHAEDLGDGLEQFRRTLAGEIDSYRLRKRYLHAEGHAVWGDLSVALVRADDGRPLHFIAQVLDVTEQKRHEERLEAARAEIEHERQTLEAIFETVSVGLLLITGDGHYERMNRRHRETMSLPFPEGHHGEAGQLGAVYFPDGKTLMAKEDMPSYRALQGEEFDDYTYWVGDDPRTRAAFSTSARQVRGPSGEKLGAALAYQEITDLMRAMQVQDQFVSSVSHELRTPLTSVLGYLEMLSEDEELPPSVLGQLSVIRRNALRLQTLLADLLHVAQAGEGALPLQRATADLAALVHQAVEASRPAAEKAGVRVEVEVPHSLAAMVDEQRIRQVLDNLLSNAVKYSGDGASVTVVLRQDATTIELEVSDTGTGMEPHEVEHAFDRFFRGDEARAKQIPGTGLGLNIVQSIVAAHQGEVTVSSDVGRGSTFTVRLPRTQL